MRPRRDIVCLSTHPWDGPRFRKHHLMTALAARGHRVLYVEPSRSMARRGRRGDGGVDPPLVGVRARMVREGVCVATPAALLPRPASLAGAWLNHLKMSLELLVTSRALGLRQPILWVYDPRFAPFLSLLRPSRTVFDLVDDYAGYPSSRRGRVAVERYSKRLCDGADRVILTSRVLAETYRPRAPYAVVPNGFDQTLFRPVAPPVAPRAGERPRAGFVGALFVFIDYGLLREVARRLPSVDFVFAGRRHGETEGLDALLAEPNVQHLGFIEPEHVPALLATFDVCLCPFRADRASRAVSPLKVYEYLAMRRPVVSTPMEGLQAEPVAPYIDFAEGAEAFAQAVRRRLEQGADFDAELDEVLAASTWERRCADALAFVDPLLHEDEPPCV